MRAPVGLLLIGLCLTACSQKDSAPYPGQDDREFWQRVDARNKGTAALLDQLGLAEYFAMEAYVVE